MRRPTSARHDSEPCSHSPRAAAQPPPCSSHVTPAPRSPLGPPDQAGSSSSPPTSERRRTLPYGDTRQSIRRLTANMSRRGTHDQRTASTYILGAICPKEGKAAGLILPWCNLEMMALFLTELSRKVAPGRHAVLLVDQAGWHMSAKLAVPANITIVPLPPKCPELNAQENVWQYLRDNWLSNRVFTSYTNIVDHCAYAWNRLVAAPRPLFF